MSDSLGGSRIQCRKEKATRAGNLCFGQHLTAQGARPLLPAQGRETKHYEEAATGFFEEEEEKGVGLFFPPVNNLERSAQPWGAGGLTNRHRKLETRLGRLVLAAMPPALAPARASSGGVPSWSARDPAPGGHRRAAPRPHGSDTPAGLRTPLLPLRKRPRFPPPGQGREKRERPPAPPPAGAQTAPHGPTGTARPEGGLSRAAPRGRRSRTGVGRSFPARQTQRRDRKSPRGQHPNPHRGAGAGAGGGRPAAHPAPPPRIGGRGRRCPPPGTRFLGRARGV